MFKVNSKNTRTKSMKIFEVNRIMSRNENYLIAKKTTKFVIL